MQKCIMYIVQYKMYSQMKAICFASRQWILWCIDADTDADSAQLGFSWCEHCSQLQFGRTTMWNKENEFPDFNSSEHINDAGGICNRDS